ncbi:hypothetical protein N2152v2_000837 [Parachlorella kessleri]
MVLSCDIDLLHPPQELEKRKHKLKRLVASPNSYFMDVKCQGCFTITTVFSHSQTVVVCPSCNTVLCVPTGGKARLTEEPPGFDWRFYTSWHLDAQNYTQETALRHYLTVGRHQGRLAAPLDIRLKPIACGGLCNQLYSHIHALIIARALNASTLLLPPALRRRSFGHVYTAPDGKNTTSVRWSFSPVEGLLDVERMVEYWAARGLTIQRTPPLRPALSFKTGRLRLDSNLFVGALNYNLPEGEGCMDTRVRPPQRPLPLSAYLAEARTAIGADAMPLLRGDPSARIPCVYLDTHCTFLSVETVRNLTLAAEAARGVFFKRSLVALADQVVGALDAQGSGFNGLHLRLEKDARDWHTMAGGTEALIELYLQSMKAAGFTVASLVYVASGLMTYDAGGELQRFREKVAAMGLAKRLVCKEDLLPMSALAGLHPEQLALVDLLVLLRSTHLVGFGGSSFSFLLQELRALQGRPRASAHLLYPPGLEGPLAQHMFATAGRLSD